MTDETYDVVVIGAGPGGYIAAIRAAQNGLRTACIDSWRNHDGTYTFGGTCLNAGCIPSKALLESSELYYRAREEFKVHGIGFERLALDLKAMQERKTKVVRTMTGGIAQLFKANRVEGLVGRGKLLKDGNVSYQDPKGTEHILKTRSVILATGSVPVELPSAPFDGERIVDSWGALEFDRVPKRLGVIGAGVIGLELGSVWARLGSEVTLIEALPAFLPAVDAQVAKEALRQFQKLGLKILLGAKLTSVERKKTALTLHYSEASGGEATLDVDRLIVAVGRRPYADGLFETDTGIGCDERGFIKVDSHCRTERKGVYAIGDVVRGPMLAHKGEEEGVMVADLIAGQNAEMNYDVIPSVIYTAPEIAWVGRNEEELKKAAVPYRVGSFPFAANGRAHALETPVGFVKILAHQTSDEILGVHIVGPMASELIAEAVLAMEFRASAEDIALTIHAHPTLSEAVHEAALSVSGRALNAVNRKPA
ncbi:MAG: dihydrolipoyl dehydrogenase [Gammaproteobacteria bacterium]